MNKWSSFYRETLALDLQHIKARLFLIYIDIFLSTCNFPLQFSLRTNVFDREALGLDLQHVNSHLLL